MKRVYSVWLQQALGFGATQAQALFETFGDAKGVYEATTFDDSLCLTPTQRRRLRQKELTAATAECEKLDKLGAFVMTPDDPMYRMLFGGMYAPPVVMYGLGQPFDLSNAPVVSVVGTRRHDENGALVTRRIAAGLAAGGAVVVSGGAEGLDSHALEAALDENGRCITFQACGIDMNYPKSVEPLRRRLLDSGGVILTEFTTSLPAYRHHFRIRNRLIAAAGRGLLVTQAPIGSGAVMSANWAREQDRDVFAVPGSVGKECTAGTNELLKDGARPVTNAADILMEYISLYPTAVDIAAAVKAEDRAETRFLRSQAEQPPMRPMTEEIALKVAEPLPTKPTVVALPDGADDITRTIYAALQSEAKTASELARETALPVTKILSAVTIMELKGLIACQPGHRYALRTQ